MRLLKLGYRDYPHYLRSAHWADKRREYQASGLPQDCFCGETEGIQLHHMTYERIGAEELTDLTPVCPPCHSMIHTLEARGEIGLDFTGFVNERRAEPHKAKVEQQAAERLMTQLQVQAGFEDVTRTAQRLFPLAKACGRSSNRSLSVHLAHRIVSACRRLERQLEARIEAGYVN